MHIALKTADVLMTDVASDTDLQLVYAEVVLSFYVTLLSPCLA